MIEALIFSLIGYGTSWRKLNQSLWIFLMYEIKKLNHNSCSPSAVSVSTSPGNLSEMHVLKLYPGSAEWESLEGGGPQNLCR